MAFKYSYTRQGNKIAIFPKFQFANPKYMFEGGDLRTFRQIQDLAIPFQKADDRVNIPSK